MTYIIGIINLSLLSIIGLTPQQKFSALKSMSDKKPNDNNGLLWAVSMVVIILLLLAINKIVQIWKNKAENNANWVLFNSRIKELGLDQDEIEILTQMIKLMDLDHQPHSVLTVESDFQSGSEKYFEMELSSNDSDQDKTQYKQKIDQLRAKLRFDSSDIDGKQSSSKQIREETSVTVTIEGQDGDFPAVAQERNMENLILKIKPEHANICNPGDKWLVRFITNKSLWEFETSIISKEDDLVFLAHTDKMKFVNIREYDRVPVEQRALIGKFIFHNNDNRVAPPNFVEAKIVEMAGIGFRVQLPQTLHNGEKVLVILEIEPRRIIQVVGIIRNSYKPNGIHREYGLELLGLSPTEVAELAQITKQASANNKRINNKANWKQDVAVPV